MGTKIHVLAARITGSVGSFVAGMKTAGAATKQLRQSWGRAAKDISSSATRIGLAVGALTGLAVKKFADFESAMVSAGAVTRTLGTRDFKTLEAAALKMGETTIFTATESANAILTMGLAGLKTKEAISALPGALQLASAAEISIADAATIAARNMRAFGLDASQLGRINDTLVATFTRANTDIRQLAEALKISAPVAKTMGVEIEEVSAVLAQMAEAGFTGTLAGTALKNAFIQLANPTSKGKKLLDAFGVAVGQDLFEKLQRIETGMANLTTEEEKLSAGIEIFGRRGGPQLLAVFEKTIKVTREFAEETRKLGGITKDMSDAKLATLKGQFTLMKSAMESVQISMGKKLRPEMEAFAITIVENKEAIAEFALKMIDFVKAVIKLVKEHPRLSAFLALLKVASILGITTAVISLAKAFGALGKAIILMAASAKVAAFFSFMKAGLISLGLQAVGTALAIGVLKAALLGLGGIAVAGVFIAIIFNLKRLNAEMRESVALTDKLRTAAERRASKRLEKISGIGDPKARVKALQEEKKTLERRMSQALQSSIDANTRATELEKNVVGDFVVGAGKSQRELAKRELAASNRIALMLDDVDAAIADAQKEARKPPAQRKAVPGAAPVGGGAPAVRRGPAFIQSQIGSEIAFFTNLLNAGKISVKNFNLEMEELANELQGEEFQKTFRELNQELKDGKINQDQFNIGIQEWSLAISQANAKLAKDAADRREESRKEAESRLEEAKQNSQSLRDNFRAMSQAGVGLEGQAIQFASRLNELIKARVEERITVEQLAFSIKKMTIATSELIALEEEARKIRILTGQATKKDILFLKLQVARARGLALTQRVNQGFQNMVNRLAGVNKGVRKVTKGFGNLRTKMNDFGKSIGDAAQRRGPATAEQFARAQAGLSRAFANRSFRIALVKNNIALLQQALRFVGGGFRGGQAAQRRRILSQINGHLRELAGLLRTPPPAIVARRFGFGGLIDPGLQRNQNGVAANTGGGTNITINTAATDGRSLVRDLELEFQIRGKRL